MSVPLRLLARFETGSSMGAGASAEQINTAAAAASDRDVQKAVESLPDEAKTKLKAALHGGEVTKDDATLPTFENLTPMLVMRLGTFEEQGRIEKNVKPWREAALKDGRLVEYVKVEGGSGTVTDGVLDGAVVTCLEGNKVAIFISHTW